MSLAFRIECCEEICTAVGEFNKPTVAESQSPGKATLGFPEYPMAKPKYFVAIHWRLCKTDFEGPSLGKRGSRHDISKAS
jgi:hypothetical protein